MALHGTRKVENHHLLVQWVNQLKTGWNYGETMENHHLQWVNQL